MYLELYIKIHEVIRSKKEYQEAFPWKFEEY
jgi:hypothetical protein